MRQIVFSDIQIDFFAYDMLRTSISILKNPQGRWKWFFANFDGANFVRSLNERVAEYFTSNPHDFLDVDHDKISRSNDTVIIFPDDSVIRSSGFFRGILGRAAEHLLSIRIDQSIGGVQQWVKRISEG